MQIARLASFVHKWLALLVGRQIVFWVVSGFFFTLFPIEQIRSEDLIRPAPVARAIDTAALGDLRLIRDTQSRAPVKLSLEQRADGPVAVAEFGDGAPALFDAASLRQLSPLNRDSAMAIASGHVTLARPPIAADLIQAASAECGGALPAWRVQFADSGLSVYVAANTGSTSLFTFRMTRKFGTVRRSAAD